MDIDFHEQCEGYSTPYLLKITMQPDTHKPALITAASNVLKTRSITQADTDEAEKLCMDEGGAEQNTEELIPDFKSFNRMPEKWANTILIVCVLHYLRALYMGITSMNYVLHSENGQFRTISLMSYIDLIYLPVVFFMFYKRMRWGWILLFASKLFTIIPVVIYYFTEYLPIAGTNLFPSALYGLLLNIGVVIFLWKPDVASIFNVATKTSAVRDLYSRTNGIGFAIRLNPFS